MDALDSARVRFEPVLIALLARLIMTTPRAARSASATTTGVEK
ncbi:hypothetical protein [Homoserinimonas sp. OAct 916]|nr:hypothetical protein [Homoserinimonas sp. OAct 916]